MPLALLSDVQLVLGSDVHVVLGSDVHLVLGSDVHVVLGSDVHLVLGSNVELFRNSFPKQLSQKAACGAHHVRESGQQSPVNFCTGRLDEGFI